MALRRYPGSHFDVTSTTTRGHPTIYAAVGDGSDWRRPLRLKLLPPLVRVVLAEGGVIAATLRVSRENLWTLLLLTYDMAALNVNIFESF